jgi:hypothetical protein
MGLGLPGTRRHIGGQWGGHGSNRSADDAAKDEEPVADMVSAVANEDSTARKARAWIASQKQGNRLAARGDQ